ncbi:MAG TPA: hypothetical protein VFZ83_06895 [Acidimicrobiia bacterium]|nr:hypothetical protein [Acidimicrobiia bacterium]
MARDPLGIGHSALVSDTERVRRIVRGEVSCRDLSALGVSLTETEDGQQLTYSRRLILDALPLSDLAIGLHAHWRMGTELREWATAMLMLSDIQFVEAESSDEEALLEGLWAAAAGEAIDESTLALARRLASA